MRALKTKIIGASLAMGAVVTVCVLALPFHGHFLNPGAMTAGHEAVECVSCHAPAPGTTRQQIQANIAYFAGHRKAPAPFWSGVPGTPQCSSCHARDNDPHAVHRFLEPRFAEAVKAVDATSCTGCHSEHQGRRVSVAPGFCASCHDDLTVKNDSLDVPHRALIAEARWSTCLGCHDYHANHERRTQQRLTDAYATEVIEDYLRNGADPFGSIKRQTAREVRP